MKKIEKVYYTVLILSIANAFISPFFFEGNQDFKYDKIADIPAMKAMGYSLLVFCLLAVTGVLYGIWSKEDD